MKHSKVLAAGDQSGWVSRSGQAGVAAPAVSVAGIAGGGRLAGPRLAFVAMSLD